MARVIWKGAISFGLVHVPVGLYPASREDDIDFDWLDKRSMDPVGYKRVNKRTGREIKKEDIVRGVKLEDGDYVLLSDEEIQAAYPQSTQTIAIEAFVTAVEIPFLYLEKPYYLAPIGKAGKVYALLREAMLKAGCIGIARVVMHAKEHLAALIPSGEALMLNTLRWPNEIRPAEELAFPPEGAAANKLAAGEMKMAEALIADMTMKWQAEDYADQFRAAIMALIRKKSEAGDTERVTPLEAAADSSAPSNVVDLTELLKRSLGGRGKAGKKARAEAEETAAAKPRPKRGAAATRPSTKSVAKPARRKAA